MLLTIYLTVFILSLSIVMGYTRPTKLDKALQLRLADIRDPRRSQGNYTYEDEQEEKKEPTLTGKISAYLQRYTATARLRLLLLQTRSKLTVGSYVLYSVAIGMLLSGASAVFLSSLPLDLCVFFIGLLIPFLWLVKMRARLLKTFGDALPDAMDLMSRALRAGHSIQQSIELIAEQSPEPLASEFAQAHQEQRFGLPFRDALLQMSDRVPLKDLRFFVTAILVQKETGSDLIEILDRTTAVIRDRVRVAGEIRTYTAQGKLTGWILSLLPFALLLIISVMSPGYTSLLFHDPLGQKMLGVGSVMITLGSLVIRHIVAVEI
jgi:tight adherence protein B